MTTDFTRIFHTPDELADFLMLPDEEQNEILAELAGKDDFGLIAVCRRPSNECDRTTDN